MRSGGDDLWRLWAFLASFALVLACSSLGGATRAPLSVVASPSPASVVATFEPGGSAPASASSSGWLDWWSFDWWTKVVGTSGAVAAAVIAWVQLTGLREDQRQAALRQEQIAAESLRRPELRVGFTSGGRSPDGTIIPPATEVPIRPVWQDGADLSDPLLMRILVRNFGNATARDLVVNVALPPDYNGLMQSEKGSITVDDAGNVRVMYPTRYLHPGVNFEARFSVTVPRGAVGVPIAAGVIAADMDGVTVGLMAIVDASSPQS